MASVRVGRLIEVYETWCGALRAAGADEGAVARMEEAIAELRDLPVDEEGRVDLPSAVPGDPGGPPADRPAVRASEPTLAQLTADEIEQAVDVGALVPIGSAGVHDTRRKWHRLLGVWKGCRRKARLISDLRPANACLRAPPTFSLPCPAQAAWREARWAAKVDLASAFWTLLLSDAAARAMSTVADGVPVEWRAMPFGWTWAPLVFHRALNPLIRFLEARHPTCRWFKYLDDILIIAPTEEACGAALAELRQRLDELGFQVSDAKSSAAPTQELEFLGVWLNFRDHESGWPRRHAEAVAELATAMAADRRPPLPLVRRFLGKLSFLCQLCPILAVWRRPVDDDVAAHLAAGGSEVAGVALSAAARDAARWWAANAVPLSVRSFPWPTGSRFVVRCDASEWAGGVTLILPDGSRRTTTLLLPPWMIGASSGAREYHIAVQSLEFLRGVVSDRALWRARVDVYTDSQASAGALRKGARAPPMRGDGRRLVEAALTTGATVSATWLPRDELAEEDAGSRRARAVDARLSPDVERAVREWAWDGASPDLDAFATAANARAPRWLSIRDEPGAAGVDGLRAPWAPARRVWAYPPAALARHARARAVAATADGCSVVVVGPQGVVEAGARRTMVIPGQANILLPPYDGAAVTASITLVAALFSS